MNLNGSRLLLSANSQFCLRTVVTCFLGQCPSTGTAMWEGRQHPPTWPTLPRGRLRRSRPSCAWVIIAEWAGSVPALHRKVQRAQAEFPTLLFKTPRLSLRGVGGAGRGCREGEVWRSEAKGHLTRGMTRPGQRAPCLPVEETACAAPGGATT